MRNLKAPAEIEYGWIRDTRYLPDFGRHEATVMLRLQGAQKDVQIITSVAQHPDESPKALRQRLVMDAVRLLRMSDVGFEVPTDPLMESIAA